MCRKIKGDLWDLGVIALFLSTGKIPPAIEQNKSTA